MENQTNKTTIPEGFLTLNEAVEKLLKAKVIDSKVRYPDQAVKKQFLQTSVLEGIDPGNYKKRGWLVKESSLNELIEIGSMSQSELLKEVIELRRKIAQIESESTKKESRVPKSGENPKTSKISHSETNTDDVLTIGDVRKRVENGESPLQIAKFYGFSRDIMRKRMETFGYKFNNTTKQYDPIEGKEQESDDFNILTTIKKRKES